ncbi:BAG family molecular chaperone regulator 1-like [Bolinopsis microptera]|uniref:BAG family molecular chaperone regulator 1-like n=1 Tax=Bolinopsis microptera TaxID=2820187 RepID=UPI00307AF59C
MYKVTVSHGAKKHQISIRDSCPTSEDLSTKIEAVTGVPLSRQKLIHKGKQIAIGGFGLPALGVSSGSKIMLLGRQDNPQNDALILKINKVKTDAEQIKVKVTDLDGQLQGIKNGYMPDDLKAEALSKIHKQCIGCVEQSMKHLEFLDSLQSSDEGIRSLKKSTVLFIQSMLDECDKMMEKL